MSDPIPEPRLHVTVADRRWQLVPTHKMTFAEVRELKRVSGGMPLAQVEQGIQSVDPDAWLAWLYVSIRREWPTLTVSELEAAIGTGAIIEIIQSVEEETPDPPVPPLGSVEPGQPSGERSGKTTPQHSIPATGGHQTSPTPT